MLDKATIRKNRLSRPDRGAGRIARNRMRIAWMYYVEGLTQNEIADRSASAGSPWCATSTRRSASAR